MAMTITEAADADPMAMMMKAVDVDPMAMTKAVDADPMEMMKAADADPMEMTKAVDQVDAVNIHSFHTTNGDPPNLNTKIVASKLKSTLKHKALN